MVLLIPEIYIKGECAMSVIKKYVCAMLVAISICSMLVSCSETEALIEGEELLPDMSTDDFRDESGVVQWPAEILPEGFIVPAYEEIYSIERKDNVVNITLFAYQDLAKHIWPVIDLKGNLYEAGLMTYYYGNGNYLGQHFYDRISKTDIIIYEFPYDELLYGPNAESPTGYTYRLEIKKSRLPYESLSWIYPDPDTDIGLSATVFEEWPTDILPNEFIKPSSDDELTIKSMVQNNNGVFITVYGTTNDIAIYEQKLAQNFTQIEYLKNSCVYNGSNSLNRVCISRNGDYYYRYLLSYDTTDNTETVQFQICNYNEYVKK